MTLLSDLQLMLYMHVSAQTFAMTLLSDLQLMLYARFGPRHFSYAYVRVLIHTAVRSTAVRTRKAVRGKLTPCMYLDDVKSNGAFCYICE
jgi:hypothetical protein